MALYKCYAFIFTFDVAMRNVDCRAHESGAETEAMETDAEEDEEEEEYSDDDYSSVVSYFRVSSRMFI